MAKNGLEPSVRNDRSLNGQRRAAFKCRELGFKIKRTVNLMAGRPVERCVRARITCTRKCTARTNGVSVADCAA